MEWAYGSRARPLPAGVVAPTTMDPATVGVRDITDTPMGREVRSILAWVRGTANGAEAWPEMQAYRGERWMAGYDRPALVLAFSGYEAPEPEACCAVLNGSPLRAMIDVRLRGEVAEIERRGWGAHSLDVWCVTGWSWEGERARKEWAYDPERRLIWRWGDKHPSTKTWRVPHLDEVQVSAQPNGEAGVLPVCPGGEA